MFLGIVELPTIGGRHLKKENKMRMEIRASEGGADAEAFALELGQAIAKHSGAVLEMDGTTVVLGCL